MMLPSRTIVETGLFEAASVWIVSVSISLSYSRLLGRHLLVLSVQGCGQRVPGERGALDAGWKLADAAEDCQLIEPFDLGSLFRIPSYQLVKSLEDSLGLAHRFADHALRHER